VGQSAATRTENGDGNAGDGPRRTPRFGAKMQLFDDSHFLRHLHRSDPLFEGVFNLSLVRWSPPGAVKQKEMRSRSHKQTSYCQGCLVGRTDIAPVSRVTLDKVAYRSDIRDRDTLKCGRTPEKAIGSPKEYLLCHGSESVCTSVTVS
jgi:hypothetical protein